MRKLTLPLLLLALWLNLAGCGTPSVVAPTSAPLARPTQAPASNPASSAGAELGGSAWKWTGAVTGSGAVTDVSSATGFTIQFLPDVQRVGVRTQCQSATGRYTTDGHALNIQLEGLTNAVCPGDKLSGQFLAELSGVQSYRIDGSTLTLVLGADAGSLSLSR